MKHSVKKEEIRMDGKLHEVISYHDEHGHLLHKMISPLMVEFNAKDVLQVIVGAIVLAIPVSFTEETWRLGVELPFWSVFVILLLSVFFMGTFTYYTYYRGKLLRHINHFLLRTMTTYVLSFLIVSCILTLIMQAPWTTDVVIAIKRAIIVTFPASMSATIADNLK